MRNVLKGLAYLREQLRGEGKLDTFQLTKLELFLHIGEHPQCSQAEVEKALGIPGGQFSRYTKEFTVYLKDNKKVGLDILQLDFDLAERRRYLYSLNKKGQKIFDEFKRIVEGKS